MNYLLSSESQGAFLAFICLFIEILPLSMHDYRVLFSVSRDKYGHVINFCEWPFARTV